MKAAFTVILAFLCVCSVSVVESAPVRLFEESIASHEFPDWIDFTRILKKCRAKYEQKALVADNIPYIVRYESNPATRRIQRIKLIKKDTKKVIATAEFSWSSPRRKAVLKQFVIKDQTGKLVSTHQFGYDTTGSPRSLRSKFTKGLTIDQLSQYDPQGHLVRQKARMEGDQKIVKQWERAIDGTPIYASLEQFEGKNSQLVYKEVASQKDQRRHECMAYQNGVLTSHRQLEWQLNDKNQVTTLTAIGMNGERRHVSYEYDTQGNLLKKVNANGVAIFYRYDEQNRLIHLCSSDNTVDYELTYDSEGRITVIQDAIHETLITRTFTTDGKLSEETCNGKKVTFIYDTHGRKNVVILPDTSSIEYVYKNGKTIIRRFNPDGRWMYEKEVFSKKVGTTLHDTPGAFSVKLKDSHGRYTIDAQYDRKKQLTGEQGPFCHNFQFDRLGVLLSKDDEPTERSPFCEIVRYKGAQYGYDNNGNRISEYNEGRERTFVYDALDRLIAIKEGETVVEKYVYDILYRKIYAQNEKETIQYIWDGEEELGRIAGDIITTLKITHENCPVIIELNKEPHSVTVDFRGNIIELNKGDEKESYRYSVFGEEEIWNEKGEHLQTSKFNNPYGFCGKSYVQGLWDFGKRYYDPFLCVWLTQDPLVFADGLNTTCFVHNDPLHFVDPTGLFAVPAAMKEMLNGARHMCNRTVETLTFAKGKLDWFFDFRSHFEDVAFKIMNMKIWTLIGYNPDPNLVKMAGTKDASEKVRLTLINGILNTYTHATENAELVAKLHGDTAVHYLYASSSGFTADILRAIYAKVGFATPQSTLLANTWRKLIKEMGGVKNGGIIIHYAHSLGGADTYRALMLLKEEERRLIRVRTFGSPFMIPQELCQEAMNYVSRSDTIPVFDVIGYTKGAMGYRNDIKFLDSSRLWPLDHGLTGDTYRTTIEELGRQFQTQYLTKKLIPKSLPFISKSSDVIQKIQGHIDSKEYVKLGKLLAIEMNKSDLSVATLNQIAAESECVPLKTALAATHRILKLEEKLGLKIGELVQLALFIETELPTYIKKEQYYFLTKDTGLPRIIEYDKKSRRIFIHLGTNGVSIIGQGKQKVVTKTILYDSNAPEIVATCRAPVENREEMQVIEELQGIPGIVEGRAFILHTRTATGEKLLHIILKYYNAGTIRAIFHNKAANFSTKEKMQIALQLLQGLEGLHNRGLIHRDLHDANFLVDVTENGKGKRVVQAAITDFGKTISVDKMGGGITPQAYRLYIPPEGFRAWKMKAQDYYYSDVYALGCVLYEVFHERMAPWVQSKYFSRFERKDRNKLVQVINRETKARREELTQKSKKISAKERFEALILRMVQPNAKERGTAAELRQELATIIATD